MGHCHTAISKSTSAKKCLLGLTFVRLQSIHPRHKVPVKAAILCWAIIAILGFVYLGSTTAFNALVGCNVLLANISFAFPIALLLFGRRKYLKPSLFPLGNFLGPIINAVALVWIIFMVVFFDFPFTMPVHADNMSGPFPLHAIRVNNADGALQITVPSL